MVLSGPRQGPRYREKIEMLYNNDPCHRSVQASRLNMPVPSRSRHWWHLADRVGATASVLCAVHCAALPFVLALLPLLGLGFLAGHVFERVFVACAAALAMVVLVVGYRHHHRLLPLVLAGPALALLLAGVCVDLDADVLVHTVLVTMGGSLLAVAHLLNLRFSRRGHACTPASPA